MVGFKSYIPTGTFSKAQFQMLLKMQKKKKKRKDKGQISSFCHTFPIHNNGNVVFRWNKQDSIRNTFQQMQDTFDAKEYRKSDKKQRGQKCSSWYSPIPIRRMEFKGVNGNAAESIHVHKNYWSCNKPNLRQVRYKPDMPRS